MLRTGLRYSKKYQILDLSTGDIDTIMMRSDSERKNQVVIEVDNKTGTCDKCRVFEEITNYFILTKKGGANVNICPNCEKTHFANPREKLTYVVDKLLSKLGKWVFKDQRFHKLLRIVKRPNFQV